MPICWFCHDAAQILYVIINLQIVIGRDTNNKSKIFLKNIQSFFLRKGLLKVNW